MLITIDTDAMTVTVDDQEPQQIQSAEEACSIVEQVMGQPDADEAGGEEMPMTEEDFAGGFNAVRQGGLNPK